MRPEFVFQIGPNWPQIGKMEKTSQCSDMTSSESFFDVFCFSCQV